MPDFLSPDFIRKHTQSILDFYELTARDPKGGFFQNFLDDGTVFDPVNRHLVSSTRFVFNYAEAYRRGYGEHYANWAREGIDYLETKHKLSATQHYGWMHGEQLDNTAMAYGQAFVILAYAHAHLAGVVDGRSKIAEIDKLLQSFFYQPEYRAYADQRSADLQQLDPYRGQNANMHLCEAYIAAYRATDEALYFDRADSLARRFAGELAEVSGGLIWEHYDTHWNPDWEYNIDKPDDLYKPWGFQPGHQTEWTKLLLQLNQLRPDDWYVQRARALFDAAMNKGWDKEFGGLVYGFAPDGTFADANKYFWVQAESLAAAYRLYKVTGEQQYLDWYTRIWQYSWDHLVDHTNGAWYRIVARDGSKMTNEKSPMGKVDYHTLGACWDVLDCMKE